MNDDGEKNLELTAQMEALYKKLGISVYKSNGDMKNTYELLQTLAPIYQKATVAEKAYITETIAGKYQAQNAVAILNNFATAVKATETAMNSAGSAAKENDKVINSIQGHINSFKSAFEELSKNVINNQLIKSIIDVGTALLQLGNSDMVVVIARAAALALGFKMLQSAISGTSSIVKKIGDSISGAGKSLKSFGNIITAIINRSKVLNLQQKVNNQTLKQTKLEMLDLGLTTDGVNTKKQAQISINNSLKASTLALNAALGIASLALSAGISLYQKHKQAQQDAIDKTLDDSAKADKNIQNINSTISKVEELRGITDSSTSTYEDAAKARKELSTIQKQLINDYGLESDKINLVTGSLSEQILELKRLKKEQAADYVSHHRDAYNDAKNKVYGDGLRQNYGGDSIAALGTTGNHWSTNERSMFFLGDKDGSRRKKYIEEQKFVKQYIEDYEKIMSKYGEVQKTYDLHNKELTSLSFDAKNIDENKKGLEEWRKYLLKHEKEIVKSGVLTQKDFDNALSYTTRGIDDLNKKYGDHYKILDEYKKKLLAAAGEETFKEELKKLADTEGLSENNVKALIKKYDGLDEALKVNKKSVKDLIEEYQNMPVSLQGSVGAINGALKSINDNELTRSQILKIDKNSPQELQDAYGKLKEVAEGSHVSLEKLVDYLVSIGKIAPDVSEKISTSSEILAKYHREIKDISASLDSLQAGFNACVAAQEEYNENGYITIDTLQDLLAKGWEYYDALVDENGQIRLNQDSYKDLVNAKLSDLETTITQSYYEKLLAIDHYGTADATAAEKVLYEQLVNSWKKSHTTIDETRRKIEALQKTINDSGNETKKKAMSQATAEYKDSMALFQSAKAGVQKSLKSAMGSGRGSRRGGGSNRATKEKEWWETELEKLKQQFSYSEITIEEYIRGLDNLLGRVQRGSDAWRKINEELQKQRLTKIEDDYKRGTISLDEYINKLKELSAAYRQGSKSWQDLADKIKKALQDKAKLQKDNLATSKNAAAKLIDEEIDKLKNLKNSQEEYYDKLIEDKKKANEETNKELELAKLQEALANAKREKTKKVWHAGIGWVKYCPAL